MLSVAAVNFPFLFNKFFFHLVLLEDGVLGYPLCKVVEIRPEQAIEPYAQANKAQTKMPSIRNIWQKMAEMMIGKKQDLRVNGNILC